MSILENKANLVCTEMQSSGVDKTIAFDPFIILMIVQIIVSIVEFYFQHCKKTPSLTLSSMQNPGILERWHLRRIIRDHVADAEMNSFISPKLTDAYLKVAKTLTEEDVNQMFEEAKTR